jgi:hypothetical protein
MEMYNAGVLDPETLIERSEIGDTKQIIERLIKYGKVADPNDPQVKIDKIIKSITDRISFNVSSTDPTIVQGALQEILENEKMLQNQLGVPNENLPEGQDLKARGLGKLTPEEEAMKKEEEAISMGGQEMAPEQMAPEMEGQQPSPEGEEAEMMALMEELAQQGVPKEEAMAIIQERMNGGTAPEAQAPTEASTQAQAPEGIDPEILAQLEEMVKSGMSPEEAMATMQGEEQPTQEGGFDEQSAQLDEQTVAVLKQLVEQGVPEEMMEQIVLMLQQGVSLEEILEMLSEGQE